MRPMYGATISESPAPYLVWLYIGSGPCTAPAIPGVVGHANKPYEISGAVHGPDPIESQTKYGAGLAEIVAPYMGRVPYGAGPSTAPDFLKSWRRTWGASYMEPDQVRRQTSGNCASVIGSSVATAWLLPRLLAPYMVRI